MLQLCTFKTYIYSELARMKATSYQHHVNSIILNLLPKLKPVLVRS